MGEVNSPCAEVLPAANRSYGANAPPARRPVGCRCGPVLNIDFSRPFHVGAKSALLRRSFIPTGEKNVIRPLPCSSSPNRTQCVGLRFVAALWATFFVSDKNIAFNRPFQKEERHLLKADVFLFGATDVTRTHDLLITKHGQTVQTPQNSRFPPFPLPRRILSSTLVSIISINSFCRVGHGVGQRPWSSSRNSGDISKVAV